MDNLAYIIIKLSRHLKNALDKKLLEYDVTAAQFSVLYQIKLKNGFITAAEVAERLDSDRPTISDIVYRLEEKGFICKVPNPQDRRSTYLKVTEEAADLVDKLQDKSDELNKEIFQEIENEDLTILTSSLQKIMRRVEKL